MVVAAMQAVGRGGWPLWLRVVTSGSSASTSWGGQLLLSMFGWSSRGSEQCGLQQCGMIGGDDDYVGGWLKILWEGYLMVCGCLGSWLFLLASPPRAGIKHWEGWSHFRDFSPKRELGGLIFSGCRVVVWSQDHTARSAVLGIWDMPMLSTKCLVEPPHMLQPAAVGAAQLHY
jgi:hypothetical protein